VFAGSAGGDELVALYADALAVVYAPFDEDYGYVTLEAFLSEKPVITASDSGGTLEFVVDGENGFVCPPEPEAIGLAVARLAADRQLAARLGRAGLVRARTVTWDGVVEQLLG
jgi:glycosyltransferase involved in cell wall biosynthesis